MKEMISKKITAEEKNVICSEYEAKGDLTLLYSEEFWIGLNGTTTIKTIVEAADSDMYVFTDYGFTQDELRDNILFVKAFMTDLDVNHSLPDLEKRRNLFFSWIRRESNEIPVSPCGLYNFWDFYIRGNRH